MKTIINPLAFTKALEYADARYFSQPYSLSPILDRWFNQLAVVELDNGELIHISNKEAVLFVELTVDANKSPKKSSTSP
jgi:hypothetical protein